MKLNVAEDYFLSGEREGFFVSELMRRCWAAKCQMLYIIGDICKRNNIRWYVDYGTLLGAARHRGFVPWDDDIDISMPREDYNRAISMFKKELPQDWYLMIFGENLFSAPWSYILNRVNIDMGDSEREAEITGRNFGCPYRCFIDLFPLDYVPADAEERYVFLELHEMFFDTIQKYEEMESEGYLEGCIEQIKLATGQELPPIGAELRPALGRLEVAFAQIYTREQSIGIENIGNMANHAMDKWRDISWYDETIYVPFEMIEVPIPAGYINILENVFGSGWMTPVKNTAAHEYPFYKSQEKEICQYWQEKGQERPPIDNGWRVRASSSF